MKKTLLAKGTSAPDFRLRDQHGTALSLADAVSHGPAILIFYPGDQTPGCTIQLSQFRDEAATFERLGIRVIGINPGSSESHAAFADKLKLKFTLLSDVGGKVSKAYGAQLPAIMLRIVQRTVYGIDANRIIRYSRRGMPKPSDVLRALKPFVNQKTA